MPTTTQPANLPVVTQVTARAAVAETLSDADYRDIYDELRTKCGLRQFVEVIRSAVSHAWWAKYEHGQADLTRARKVELRAAVGLPALPPAVADIVAAIDPDATVYRVSQDPAAVIDRVILLGADAHEPLALRINGSLRVTTGADPAGECPGTSVTKPAAARQRATLTLARPTWRALNQARLVAGLTWDAYLRQALIPAPATPEPDPSVSRPCASVSISSIKGDTQP